MERKKTLMSNFKEFQKNLKGYQYDSLVYRFRIALERGREARIRYYEERFPDESHVENRKRAYAEEGRDLMRFCQILDEAIGEHT